MKKILINERSGDAPLIVNEIQSFPIPFDTDLKLNGVWEIRADLYSTRGGGAQWEINVHGAYSQYLTWGRYNPRFYARVMNPRILWVHNKNHEDHEDIDDFILAQEFMQGFNQFTKEIILYGEQILPVPVKGQLHKVIQKIENGGYEWTEKQGHLSLFKIENQIPQTSFYYNNKNFLNHQILGGNLIAKERIESTLYGLIKFHREGWVVSPDHLYEPILVPEGVYVASHPEPRRDNID